MRLPWRVGVTLDFLGGPVAAFRAGRGAKFRYVYAPLVLAGALITGASVRSQSIRVSPVARPLPAFLDLQDWIQISKAHQVGQIDDAVRALAKLSRAQIQTIDDDLLAVGRLLDPDQPESAAQQVGGRTLALTDISALFDLPKDTFLDQGRPLGPVAIRKPDSAPRQAIARIMLRAAMLHTDFLTAVSREEMVGAGASRGGAGATLRVSDAVRSEAPDFRPYWSCARTAIDLALPTPIGGTLGHDWYVATAEYLFSQRDYSANVPHLEHSRQVVPDEPRLALYLGAAYENLAAPQVQATFQNGEGANAIGLRPILLQQAEFQQRSALLLDPQLADASLRLGRTLLVMARADEALPLLTRAEAALPRTESKYYAAIFTGLAEVARGHHTEALSSFERASARFPEAQSPRLAIAQVLMRAGKHDEVLAAIQRLPANASAADPWWTYDIDLISGTGNRLASVRASISERLR